MTEKHTVALSVTVTTATGARLAALVARTERSGAYHQRKALIEYLDRIEARERAEIDHGITR